MRDIIESRLRVVHGGYIWCRVAGVGFASPTRFVYDWLPVHLLNSVQTVGTVCETSSSAEFLFGI